MPPFRIAFGDETFVDLTDQDDYTFPHPIQRWVMPVIIVSMCDGQMVDARVMGTCFTIAPGLAVTAKHVLAADFTFAGDGGEGPPDVAIQILYMTDEPIRGQGDVWGSLLEVDTAVVNADHDLALLRFKAPTFGGRHPSFPVARLTLDPPQPGEQVFALGYTESSSAFRPPNTIELAHKIRASRGVVQELHIPGRDSVVLNFPALTGDYPCPGGMSGGPILNSRGCVCASVWRALPPSLDDDLWTSSASLLAYLFTMEIEVPLDDVPGVHSLRELAQRAAVPTDGTERKLEFRTRGDGQIDFVWRK
jgi:Trypsin-like peptidase domain